ncbi:CUB domain protein [Ancylostoma caninum]|uniref:CUB domain protein n=1 Tax=Ancylostoma caninum TaxID=29170 RepID=A0A368GMX8_ANCCA|nr:CUB domain protein [Ancylostoma caninum]
MNFTSDGTAQGVGFNGSVHNIDCTCGSRVYQMTPNDTSLQIASPGFLNGAPTYCPKLDCFWTIKFPTNHEVILNISYINLRTGSQQDQFFTADNFGRILLSTNSTIYYGPTKLIITSGQFSVNFTSTSTMVFSPPLSQQGFLLDLSIVKIKGIFGEQSSHSQTSVSWKTSQRSCLAKD